MNHCCKMLSYCKCVLGACLQVFLDGQAALEEEERKEERAGKEFRRFNRRCHCSLYATKFLSHIHASTACRYGTVCNPEILSKLQALG